MNSFLSSCESLSVLKKPQRPADLDTKVRPEAKRRLLLEDTVKPAKGYKTLFYGLKRNHERNVAIVHPLMFLLRRVIYAIVIVFMGETMLFPVLIVMSCCLAMLAYALLEMQW